MLRVSIPTIQNKNSDKDYRVNQRIKADKVRIVFGGNNDGAESTVLSLNEAIKLAKDQGLDLVEEPIIPSLQNSRLRKI